MDEHEQKEQELFQYWTNHSRAPMWLLEDVAARNHFGTDTKRAIQQIIRYAEYLERTPFQKKRKRTHA